ncbi:unnamed protein product [Closterium sp. NIES-54]
MDPSAMELQEFYHGAACQFESRRSSLFEAGQIWDVGAAVLGGFVPGVVLVKCVAVAGALTFSSWCAAIVVTAAALQRIHSSTMSDDMDGFSH